MLCQPCHTIEELGKLGVALLELHRHGIKLVAELAVALDGHVVDLVEASASFVGQCIDLSRLLPNTVHDEAAAGLHRVYSADQRVQQIGVVAHCLSDAHRPTVVAITFCHKAVEP